MCISVMYIHRSGIVSEEHNVSEAFILFTFPPALCVLVIQSCPTPCNPWTTGSLPGSSACGILQARILEWVAIPFSRGSSRPRDRTRVSCLLHWQAGSSPLGHLGSPDITQADTQNHRPEIQQSLKTLPTKVWMKNTVLHISEQRTSSHCRHP